MPTSSKPDLTQRAYTLRLAGTNPRDHTWRDGLWKTHEAVNLGAKAFGDWLLTMRGGLDPTLAESTTLDGAEESLSDVHTGEIKRRRIILALSWLSVESEHGAPAKHIVAHTFDTAKGRTDWQTVDALKEILKSCGLSEKEIESWISDCSGSLSSPIRDDAVWVNRRHAFDEARKTLGPTLTREQVHSLILKEFLPDYFSSVSLDDDEDAKTTAGSASTTEQPEFRTWARGWLSFQWGTGEKSDNTQIASVLARLSNTALDHLVDGSGEQLIAHLIGVLGVEAPKDEPIDCLRKLVGWKTGRSSKGKMALETAQQKRILSKSDIEVLKKKLSEEAKEKNRNAHRTAQEWARNLRLNIEEQTGMPFISGRNLIGEFAVMLDHAARRVSLAHTWIKRAEAERRRFEEDAAKIDGVPEDAKKWLGSYCKDRSLSSGALESYRIRKRAKEGWKEVVAAWSRKECRTEKDRIEAAREVQADVEKFGDIQLFEAVAVEDAVCVWKQDGKESPVFLSDYVIATDAEAKQIRFKVPAYRHPDPLRHPVFCDFGNSRWGIKFDIHEMRKHAARNSGEKTGERIDPHGMSMGLWDGASVSEKPLRWRSKRFTADLIPPIAGGIGETQCVSRADRLGRAASAVNKNSSIRVLQLFNEKEWNGRLQVPRSQLDDLANHLLRTENKWDSRACRMRDRLGWLVSFSAKLQPQGPWSAFAERNGLRPDWKYWPHAIENKKRQGLARLMLARLPGLRVLSVDLGHRYAAACAVWEAVSEEQIRRACEAVGAVAPGEADLYFSNKAVNNGKTRTTVYRRIGASVLSDGKCHPAPWARLDRQFLIKLQGEDVGARKASSTEIAEVEKLEGELGFERSVLRKGSELAVDELMHESVRLLRLALRRHSDYARISFNLTSKKKLLSGGREEALDPESRIELLTDMLTLWRELFSNDRWTDEWAKSQWQDHIQPLLGEVVLPEAREKESETAQKRKKRDEELRVGVKRVAEKLASNPSRCVKLNILWAARWQKEDKQWRPRLRWIRDWLMPRGVGRNGKRHQSIRHVGGLSLSRIATFKSLYQLEKSFKMRPEPDDLRKNVPKPGDESARHFGQRILDAMENMRENRVKQLASRIAEAALGIGREEQAKDGKQQRRPQERIPAPQFAPCHAVVIENLTRYRPEETRTRRENQQLMSWSSSKVKKYLSEACQLNGLHLREVPAAYTSRQDSRTGAPGIRCKDVSVKVFLESPFWQKQIAAADQKVRDGGNGDSRERYLLALRTRWAAMPDANKAGRSVRIPYRGGEVFVSAKKNWPASSGLQADLNAAANIGLKALLDPDWSGRWWYVPCDAGTYRPIKDKVGGCLAIKPTEPLIQVKGENDQSPDALTLRRTRNVERRVGSQRESKDNIANLWRDISVQPVNNERATESEWQPYSEYWNKVQFRVVNVLREKAGLPRDSATS